ncbi:MAG: kynureninase [Allobranchiibius sp.]
MAKFADRFLPAGDDVTAYLDGNSLGRPLRATAEALEHLVYDRWGGELIRGWTQGEDPWMGWPEQHGDLIGGSCLGAAAGQTVVADSTTVLLYKLARAAVAARPGRDEIVLDTENFPTDRYVLEGICAERSMKLRWIETDPAAGIEVDQLIDVVNERTALVVFSNVAYRSAYLADVPAVTKVAHDAGALVLWDLSHSVGAVPMQLDEWGVDLAVGCTYKYLNGGPGAPAFAYVRADLQDQIQQPIQGWMGRADPFTMGPGYTAAPGIRGLVSGTPSVLGMVGVREGAALVAEVGIAAIRVKSVALTALAIELADAVLTPQGVRLVTPRDPERRGSHVTIARADFEAVNAALWQRGVLTDFRKPDGIRLGLAPLSTSYTNVVTAVETLVDLLQ